MSADQFERAFNHPETGKTVRLCDALSYYEWHCRGIKVSGTDVDESEYFRVSMVFMRMVLLAFWATSFPRDTVVLLNNSRVR
jgi:hypothetical protein